jgi:Tol biopolymer transport system component
MMRKKLVLILLLFGSLCSLYSQEKTQTKPNLPLLKGPYFGQNYPGMIPEIFAPGIVSTEKHEHSFPSFSPDGKQVLWTSIFQDNYTFEFPVKIISSELRNEIWSEPDFFEKIPLSHSYEAFFSPDGERIYFTSTSVEFENESIMGKQDIWYVQKSDTGWMPPKNLGLIINTSNAESKATVTNNLTLYFVGHYEDGGNNYGIYKSELIEGAYQKPELLPENINTEFVDWTPYISPNETYLLFSSLRPGGYGSGDLYISYRNQDNTWSDPINLGKTINSKDNERYPYVSPDGKYLFFVSDRVDIKELNNSKKLKDL